MLVSLNRWCWSDPGVGPQLTQYWRRHSHYLTIKGGVSGSYVMDIFSSYFTYNTITSVSISQQLNWYVGSISSAVFQVVTEVLC